jgi:DNA repair protein RecO (recombination protein O)
MHERSTGLILRTRPLTETSLIVHWLSPDLGRVATVAKGARRPKSPFAGKLDLFFLADFSFFRSRRSDLHTLREVGLRRTHSALRNNLDYLQQAAYAAALIEQTTETETPLPAHFALLEGMLEFLPQQPPLPLAILAFEIKLLAESGLQPDLRQSQLSAGAQQVLEKLASLDWPLLARLRLSPAQSSEIEVFLHGFLSCQFENVPSGRALALGTKPLDIRP